MGKSSGFQVKQSGAQLYELCWVPALMGKCAEDLVAEAGVKPGDRVLDVACGTGIVARHALKKALPGGSVVGSDINAPMLDAARSIASDLELTNIEWHLGDATELPFEDASFDVVLCQQGLQFIPDKSGVLREMARVLRPGGRVAVSVWKEPSKFGDVLGEVLDRHFGEGVTAAWQVAYSLGDRDELRSLATDNGFKDACVSLDMKMGRHAAPQEFVKNAIAASPLAGDFEKADEGEQREILQEIIHGMKNCMDDGGLAIPASCHTLTARKG